MVPSHYLNKAWIIVMYTMGNNVIGIQPKIWIFIFNKIESSKMITTFMFMAYINFIYFNQIPRIFDSSMSRNYQSGQTVTILLWQLQNGKHKALLILMKLITHPYIQIMCWFQAMNNTLHPLGLFRTEYNQSDNVIYLFLRVANELIWIKIGTSLSTLVWICSRIARSRFCL